MSKVAPKVTIPKKATKSDKFYRNLFLYCSIPVALIIFALCGSETGPSMMINKDGKKEKLSKKHMPKAQFDQNEDAFEKFWTPEEKTFVEFVNEKPRTMENAVMAVVYKDQDATCKKLAKQIGKTMNIDNEVKIFAGSKMKVVGLDSKILSEEFKTQHKIASFPTVLLFAGKDGSKNGSPALQYSGLPLVRDATKRLKGWLESVDFNMKNPNLDKVVVPKMDRFDSEKAIKRGGVLNACSNAHVLYSCSPKLLKVLDGLEETSDYKQYLIEDSENAEMNGSEYFFTRYVRQDSMLPASIVDQAITKSFSDEEDAEANVIASLAALQVPVFSRLYPEALESHISLTPVLVVANQAIQGMEVLGNFAAIFEEFNFSVQFVYMYPADHPRIAMDRFGFQNGKFAKNQTGMQVSLYTPKMDFVRFLGNLSDKEEVSKWIRMTLKQWRREGVEEEEEETEGEM